MTYLEGLNPQQKEAVTYGQGPLLILAGAGSGKTKVLACRAAFLVHQGWARPYQILALTFTNKAAKELKRRIVQMVGGEGDLVVAGTFHSIFSRILRMEGREIGVNPSFTILDEEDRLRLVKQVIKDLKFETRLPRANEVVSQISRAKNNLIDVEKFNEGALDPIEGWVGVVYEEYERRKSRMESLDFDDLLMVPAQAFVKTPLFLQRCQERFRWVMVDEFQDTNYVQYFLIRRISEDHRNINVVGDDDQAIYGWRGATVANILNFPNDWNGTKIVRLEQNYRSPKLVLDIAWSVISRNPHRHPKQLWSTRTDTSPVYLFEAATDDEEARFFVTFIQEKMKSGGYAYSDFAILYRINAQSLPFERTLRAVGIPYQVVGGLRFYERKEVKDLLAYLRLVVNPDDDVAFLRVINYPPRGIGDKVIEVLSRISREKGISLWRAGLLLRQTDNILAQRQIGYVEQFYRLIEGLREEIRSKGLVVAVTELVENVGLKKRLEEEEREDPTRAESKVANLEALIDEIARYEWENKDARGLEGFLEEVALVTDIDRYDETQPKVSLLTIHNAKGLEFPVVMVGGVEEGVLPLYSRNDRESDIDEERRLFYVAVTRTINQLVLGYARDRFHWGGFGGWREPSRFLKDIPAHLLTPWKEVRSGISTGYNGQYNATSSEVNEKKLKEEDIRKGLIVRHPKFGFGTIVGVKKAGLDSRIEIDFDQVGVKILVLRYSPLEIVDGNTLR